MKELVVGVAERPQIEEELIGVVGVIINVAIEGLLRQPGARAVEGREVEIVYQKERAVVMVVVADEPVGAGGLRRDRFQRGM